MTDIGATILAHIYVIDGRPALPFHIRNALNEQYGSQVVDNEFDRIATALRPSPATVEQNADYVFPFVDPISGREVAVHFGGSVGVEHPDCLYRAEVSPELDAFYCRYCGWNGRISGAWFMDLLASHPTHHPEVT